MVLALAAPAAAQTALETKRGAIEVKVRVKGTVVVGDTVRLKSSIEGRVEGVATGSYTWVAERAPLGYLANKEMAAILDSHNTTSEGVLKERWRRVYQPTPIRCPEDCFILRVFVKNKEWLKPKSLLFEAALRLQAVGRVRPEDAHWIRAGQDLKYWAVDDPTRVYEARIARYQLDIQGDRVNPGGSFSFEMSPGRYLEPGTDWEGIVIPAKKTGILVVPTDSLIHHEGSVYLPVKVSTGLTTTSLTEITSGVNEKRPILVLEDNKLKDLLRHRVEPDPDAIKKRIRDQYLPPQRVEKESIGRLQDPDATYGEDPYGD